MAQPRQPDELATGASRRRGRLWAIATLAAVAVLLVTVSLTALASSPAGQSPQAALAEIAQPVTASVAASNADHLAALLASVARRQGVAAEDAQVTQAVDQAMSTTAGRQALFDADTALAGHVFPGTAPTPASASAVTSGRGLSLAGGRSADVQLVDASRPVLKVYFVNGVNNTYAETLAQRDALEALLGVDVTLIYNSSYKDLAVMNIDACTRALRASGWADEQVAIDTSWTTWLTEKATNAVAAGLKAACAGVDTVGTLGTKVLSVGHEMVSLVELAAQRLTGSDLANSQVNSRLVPYIESDIRNGDRVIVIGHSQGTMFARNALDQAQAWWADQPASATACPGDGAAGGQASLSTWRPVPMAALYISPAFGSILDSQSAANEDLDHGAQRYVLLRGDVIFGISPLTPSADPVPGQLESARLPDPIAAHKLNTYLYGGSETRTQVASKFSDLADYVTALPGIDAAPCATTTTEPPTTSATPTSDTVPTTDTADTTAATDTTPATDTPATDTTPATTPSTVSGSDQTFHGEFIPPNPNNNPGHLTFLTNTIQITVHPDGSADGSYDLSYTMNDTYLSPDVLPGCVQTFSASGTLKLAAGNGGTGTIENLNEAAPTASGCWPGWSWSLRSRGGWRLNSSDNGRALGGIDIYGQAVAFNIGASAAVG